MEDWNESLKGFDERKKGVATKVSFINQPLVKLPSQTIAPSPQSKGKGKIYHISSDLNKSKKSKVNKSLCKATKSFAGFIKKELKEVLKLFRVNKNNKQMHKPLNNLSKSYINIKVAIGCLK